MTTDYKPGDVVVLIKEYTFAGKHYAERMEVGDEGVVMDPDDWGGNPGDEYEGTVPVRWGDTDNMGEYERYKGFWTDPDCIQLVMPTGDEVQEAIQSIQDSATRSVTRHA